MHARFPRVDALPDGGSVVADARRQDGVDQVQVFDSLERSSCRVGHFDEGVVSDPLSDPSEAGWFLDCYALNVDRACT